MGRTDSIVAWHDAHMSGYCLPSRRYNNLALAYVAAVQEARAIYAAGDLHASRRMRRAQIGSRQAIIAVSRLLEARAR